MRCNELDAGFLSEWARTSANRGCGGLRLCQHDPGATDCWKARSLEASRVRYVVTVALGSTLASILLSEDVALAEGLVAVVMLVGMQWVVAKSAVSFEPWRKFIRSDPVILLAHGNLDAEKMLSERVTEVEVDIAIRIRGFGDRGMIAYVVLEADGSMSIISKDLVGDGGVMRGLLPGSSAQEAN